MNDKKTMWVSIVIAFLCLYGAATLQTPAPANGPQPTGPSDILRIIGSIAFLIAILSGRHVVRAYRERERPPREQKNEKDALARGVALAKWLLPAAVFTFIALILIDSPKIQLLGTGEQVDAIKHFLVVCNLALVPLAFLLVLAPVASSLNRSVLFWGIGLIMPIVNLIVAGVLFSLARRELRERAVTANDGPDMRTL